VEGFGPKQAAAVFDFFHRAIPAPSLADADAPLENEAELAEAGAGEVASVASPPPELLEEEIDAALADEVEGA
jgi:hypothetical protein